MVCYNFWFPDLRLPQSRKCHYNNNLSYWMTKPIISILTYTIPFLTVAFVSLFKRLIRPSQFSLESKIILHRIFLWFMCFFLLLPLCYISLFLVGLLHMTDFIRHFMPGWSEIAFHTALVLINLLKYHEWDPFIRRL